VASIEKRPDGRYRARWREHPGGPQRTKHFDRKADADRFLDRVHGDLVRGLYVDPNAGRVPFREYAESWRASQVHRPTTAALVESHLRHHVLPFFGERPLGSIRSSDVQSWVKVSGVEDLGQERFQRLLFVIREAIEQRERREQALVQVASHPTAGFGEGEQLYPAVLGLARSRDQSQALEPIHHTGNVRRVETEPFGKFAGGERILEPPQSANL
jgi:Phage integrase, N-terminal SAM-like domain